VLEVEPVEPVVVELVLVPVLLVLGFMLLPVLVLGVSFRTCLVTLSQHFTVAEDVALDEGDVVVEVCATAIPKLRSASRLLSAQFRSYACRRYPFLIAESPASPRRDVGDRKPLRAVPCLLHGKKGFAPRGRLDCTAAG